jgi:hypothetical protein
MTQTFDEWLKSKGWVRCKYNDEYCKRGREYEDSDEGVICTSKNGCIFKVINEEDKDDSFNYALKKSPYWTLRGCDWPKGKVAIDHTVLTAIRNWAGDATESGQMKHRSEETQNEMMYNALDLIYKLIFEIEEKPINACKKDHHTEWLHWKIDQVQPLSQFSKES